MDCSHNIIEDCIDIDPDRCKQIFYCEKCDKPSTFEDYVIQIRQQMQDISGSLTS